MNRIATTILLMFAMAGLFSCGGGGTTTVGDVNSDTDTDTMIVTPEAPATVFGDHSTSVVPNQVNVLTGASPVELTAQLAEYGMVGVSKTGGWVTVELPSGTDLDWAVQTLAKEYNIAKAEKVMVMNTSHAVFDGPTIAGEPTTGSDRTVSYYPFDPMYAGRFENMYFTGETWDIGPVYIGQGPAIDAMNFQSAWDIAGNGTVAANEVRIAVIGAGFWDFSVIDWQSVNEAARFDADCSGSIAGDGTVTVGLDAAAWEFYDNGDTETANEPYDMKASLMLGVMADNIGDPAFQTGWFPRYYDINGDTVVDTDEFWAEGAVGVAPLASYILIKTGQASGENWTFDDNQIAAAIDYAAGDPAETNGGLWPNGGCGADIVLLGMWANGAVAANVSTAIQTARDNNCLVIAPAGDVVDSYGGEPASFQETPVDITVDPVTPASDANCIAVSATGFNRAGDLGTITMGETDYENIGLGWDAKFGTPFDAASTEVATAYANTGGDIAAVGSGIGWGVSPVFVNGEPSQRTEGYNFGNNINRFSSCYAAAYVAGAASIVHQALAQANGVEPTDDEVWQVLADTAVYAPLTGIANNGGLLDAGAAAHQAFTGGTLYQPAMHFTGLTISQPPAELEPGVSVGFTGVVRGATFEVAPTVVDGTAPFVLTIDWDNGTEEVVVDPWVNGDPVTLDGGWDTLGQKGVNITVEDSDGQTANWGMWINVVNPISAGITFEDELGVTYDPSTLAIGTQYRIKSNLTNVYTGLIDGTPNEITLTWDFDYGAAQDTGENATHTFSTSGDHIVQLLVEQSLLPDRLFTVEFSL